MRPLTIKEAEFIAHALAIELMNYEDEPIPPFGTRSPGVLESCLAEPFQTFGGRQLHVRFARKAAVLFYLVIKNHPFKNGNKRMAVVLTMVFFYEHKRWLSIEPKELYEIACDVAKSDPKEKDQIVSRLEKTFSSNSKALSTIIKRFLGLDKDSTDGKP